MHEGDEVDYGPLAVLLGTWSGNRGVDVAPEPDGEAETRYHETIRFEAAGDVTNAEEQTLAIVFYVQEVRRVTNDEIFHHETGYWLWDAATGCVMHSLQIPRAIGLIAGGTARADGEGGTVFAVEAALGNPDWGIVQSPFMRDKARTTAFTHRVVVRGARLSYEETTTVEIFGRTFQHTDRNELQREA